MKKSLFLFFILLAFITIQAQPPSVEAKSGMVFGKTFSADEVVDINKILPTLSNESTPVLIEGKVTEVCKAEGCWLKLDSEKGSILVRMKGHAFFVPVSLTGKTIVLSGSGKIQETSVEMLKHYAEDAGKSKEEIADIKEPKKEAIFYAEGLIVK